MGKKLAIRRVALINIGLIFEGRYEILEGRIRKWMVGVKRTRIRNGITGTLTIATPPAAAAPNTRNRHHFH